ncbi:hypothetical protein SS50377_21828 [Spironucleus salmonicida]|uniref:Uncharacterized protein n=1 Tax=Spironucleus salmonicida TaxID=348837 RepID=V6LKV6_9EUKA|nr:hypothetical protein SS50377_21828 [Spironucleus salmonicida]|eukprot:EST44371.1 Hypothetical protein SS50377_15674 [Spironucleus salmonicida]
MEALLSSSVLITQQPIRALIYEIDMENSHANFQIQSSFAEVEIHNRTLDELNRDQYGGNQDRNISNALQKIREGQTTLNYMQSTHYNVEIKHFEDADEDQIKLYIEKQRQKSLTMGKNK